MEDGSLAGSRTLSFSARRPRPRCKTVETTAGAMRRTTSSSDVTHVPSPSGRGAGGRAVLAESRLAVRSKGRQTGAQILQSALTPNHKLHPERVGVALVGVRGGRHADVPPRLNREWGMHACAHLSDRERWQ